MANGRDKRRLAAILAADVVGYSRLMEADESGTLAQLKALRKELIDPKVEEYSGHVCLCSLTPVYEYFVTNAGALDYGMRPRRRFGNDVRLAGKVHQFSVA